MRRKHDVIQREQRMARPQALSLLLIVAGIWVIFAGYPWWKLAVGCLILGRAELPSRKTDVELAFQRAWRARPTARDFPQVRADRQVRPGIALNLP